MLYLNMGNQALLAAGALSNMATSDENESPLHKAVKGGDSSILVMLIRAGANVNSQDAQGKMPLHLAAETGQSYISEVIEVLPLAIQIRKKGAIFI